MGAPKLSQLRDEYQELFDTCRIHPDNLSEVDRIIARIQNNRHRYAQVGDPLGIPWYFIAVIHHMESSLDFNSHLHNGDPLSSRTVHEPQGRPEEGEPPYEWEESARDAMECEGLDEWDDWSLPGMLYLLEGYNGWGYYHRKIKTPYLWSFSGHYTGGKFVKDKVFSPTAISKQSGAAVILRRLVDQKVISLEGQAPLDFLPLPEVPAEEFYMIQPGDTLWGIARKCGISLDELIDANPDIEDPDTIIPGLRIKIPGAPAPPVVVPPPAADLRPYDSYILRAGDTLENIAAFYEITLEELLRINPFLVTPGQQINVPRIDEPESIHAAAVSGLDLLWFELALREEQTGVQELPGRRENPRILDYFKTTTYKTTSDETPWCSAFANWCIHNAKLKGTRSAAAVSWLKWGWKLDSPRRGCIVVLWREEVGADPDKGHVGFYYGEKGDSIRLLGGNQGNRVSIKSFPKKLVRSYRWPKED